jgi:hypothetical protein
MQTTNFCKRRPVVSHRWQKLVVSTQSKLSTRLQVLRNRPQTTSQWAFGAYLRRPSLSINWR